MRVVLVSYFLVVFFACVDARAENPAIAAPSTKDDQRFFLSGPRRPGYLRRCKKPLLVLGATAAIGSAVAYDVDQDRGLPPRGAHEPFADAPKISQLEPEFETDLACKGQSACVPTSTAMGLLWLSENGFDRLQPRISNDRANKLEVVKDLSARMRKEDPKGGVTNEQTVVALNALFDKRGYAQPDINVTGWDFGKRPVEVAPPPLYSVLKKVQSKEVIAWASFYWVDQNHSGTGGMDIGDTTSHRVLITGYERNTRFGKDEIRLLVRDPWNEKPGEPQATRSLRVEKLKGGTVDVNGQPYFGARGQFLIKDDPYDGLIHSVITLTPPAH